MSFAVHEPTALAEAVTLLAGEGRESAVLAGGTDLLLRMRRNLRAYRSVVNIKFVPGLDILEWDAVEGLTLGALATFRAVERHPVVHEHYQALEEAARVVAGVQLRNIATIGGNLGNASPSADSVPPLVALGASVEMASPSGRRTLPVEDCLTGPGRTVLTPGEIFTTIRIPPPQPRSGSAFARFSPRSAMDIGIASVAASVVLDADGRCSACRVALGAVSPIPLRATAAEDALRGERLTHDFASVLGDLAAGAARPISDIRGSGEYRRAIVKVLSARVITLAVSRAMAKGAS